MTMFRQIASNAMQHSTVAAPGFVKSIIARKNHPANRRRRKKDPWFDQVVIGFVGHSLILPSQKHRATGRLWTVGRIPDAISQSIAYN